MSKTLEESLAEFLVKVKGRGNSSTSVTTGLGQFHLFTEGAFSCTRSEVETCGKITGQELVTYKDKLVWQLSYEGEILDSAAFDKDFLDMCLLKADVKRPYRGPILFRNRSYVYFSEEVGSLLDFTGKEYIVQDTGLGPAKDCVPIYTCNYTGGKIGDADGKRFENDYLWSLCKH